MTATTERHPRQVERLPTDKAAARDRDASDGVWHLNVKNAGFGVAPAADA